MTKDYCDFTGFSLIFVLSTLYHSLENQEFSILKNAIQVLPPSKYFNLLWIQDLPAEDHRKARKESEAISKELHAHARSTLAIGEHLLNLQELAREDRVFTKMLADFPFSVATAYRYMQTSSIVKANLSEPIYARASVLGINIVGADEKQPFGKLTRVIKQLPPPKSTDPVVIDRWISQVQDTHKMEKKHANGRNVEHHVEEPDLVLSESYKSVRRRFKRLPNNSRTRLSLIRSLIPMLMHMAKIQSAETFTPAAPPESFETPVGRPPKDDE